MKRVTLDDCKEAFAIPGDYRSIIDLAQSGVA
jgi:hypothetical protein